MGKDSIAGQIIIGVVVAAIVGIGGWLLGRATAPAVPPALTLLPETASAQVGLDVEFNAVTDVDPSNLTWRVGGQLVGQSHIAQCNTGDLRLRCRFLVPGTYSVSATVTAANGLQATMHSPVTVVFPDRYYTVFLQSPDPDLRAEAYRTLLRRVDWVAVQQAIDPLILLYDPDRGRNVYAADTEYDPDYEGADVLQGLKLRIPRFREPPRDLVVGQLQALGVALTEIPYSEAISAIEYGAVDGGFVALGDPTINLLEADLEELQSE